MTKHREYHAVACSSLFAIAVRDAIRPSTYESPRSQSHERFVAATKSRILYLAKRGAYLIEFADSKAIGIYEAGIDIDEGAMREAIRKNGRDHITAARILYLRHRPKLFFRPSTVKMLTKLFRTERYAGKRPPRR